MCSKCNATARFNNTSRNKPSGCKLQHTHTRLHSELIGYLKTGSLASQCSALARFSTHTRTHTTSGLKLTNTITLTEVELILSYMFLDM